MKVFYTIARNLGDSNAVLAGYVLVVITLHGVMLCCNAMRYSPTLNEPAHLVAGLGHWRHGAFELYRVNPPLVHLVAAFPVLQMEHNEDWTGYYEYPGARPVFSMGRDFIRTNGQNSLWLITVARWSCVPFAILGGIVSGLWSFELWKTKISVVISVTLWCFEPLLLAHGSLITSDMASTSLGLAASYLFWRWLKYPSWRSAAASGALLGLAELTKTSWLILFVAWPLIWALWVSWDWCAHLSFKANEKAIKIRWGASRFLQMALQLLLALHVIHLVYGYDETFRPLGDYEFVSAALAGGESPGNRFAGTVFAQIPVPLPVQYVLGVDIQKKDLEDYSHDSYLRGEWRNGGWWYYYIYGLSVKTTHGLQAMLIMSLCVVAVRVCRTRHVAILRDVATLATPCLLLLVLVSSHDAFNHHLRYVLPLVGFATVFAGGAATFHQKIDRVTSLTDSPS